MREELTKYNIVATYEINGVKVLVTDSAYAGKSEAELEVIKNNIRKVAQGILVQAEREKRSQDDVALQGGKNDVS